MLNQEITPHQCFWSWDYQRLLKPTNTRLLCYALEGVFPHSASTRRDPCVRVYASLMVPTSTNHPHPPITHSSTHKQPTPYSPPSTPPHHPHPPSLPPHEKTKKMGDPTIHWNQRRGIWTDAWVCPHYCVVIWVAGLFKFHLNCTVYGVSPRQNTKRL